MSVSRNGEATNWFPSPISSSSSGHPTCLTSSSKLFIENDRTFQLPSGAKQIPCFSWQAFYALKGWKISKQDFAKTISSTREGFSVMIGEFPLAWCRKPFLPELSLRNPEKKILWCTPPKPFLSKQKNNPNIGYTSQTLLACSGGICYGGLGEKSCILNGAPCLSTATNAFRMWLSWREGSSDARGPLTSAWQWLTLATTTACLPPCDGPLSKMIVIVAGWECSDGKGEEPWTWGGVLVLSVAFFGILCWYSLFQDPSPCCSQGRSLHPSVPLLILLGSFCTQL